jgi:hypothetical protein
MPLASSLAATTGYGRLRQGQTSVSTTPYEVLDDIAQYLRGYMSEFRNPNFYTYTLDGDGYYINDGGGDMYDNGNITSPWIRAGTTYVSSSGYSSSTYPFAINYTNNTRTQIDTDFYYTSLGYIQASGSQNNQFHPLTVIGARFSDVVAPIGFQIGGNSGADGGGTLASGLVYNGDTVGAYTAWAFYRQTYNAGDPSHCNVFILFADATNWNSQTGSVFTFADPVSNGGCGGYFYMSNARNILAIQTLLSKPSGGLVTVAEIQTVVQNFAIRVSESIQPPSAPTITTTALSSITANTVTSGGNVTSSGRSTITARGIVWSTSPGPTVDLPTRTTEAGTTGSFTSVATGLVGGTLYYIRAYATNGIGTGYGSELSFTTLTAPSVTTTSLTNITTTSASSGGTITSTGGATVTTRGVCWDVSPNPTIALATRTTESGSFGTGSFTASITGLSPGVQYYVRAYATTSAGTGYGNQLTFTTLTTTPTVTTTTPSYTTTTTATGGGVITSTGGLEISACGVCWDTSQNPTIALSTKTVQSGGLGSFTSVLTNLTLSTLYYIRAYATNALGTAYGSQTSYTHADIIYYFQSANDYAYRQGNTIVWYGTFTQSATPSQNTFDSWRYFLANLPSTASTLRIFGSRDTTGKTMTSNVSTFIQNMRAGTNTSVSSDGATWYVNTGCTAGSPVPSNSPLYGTTSGNPVFISWNVSGCTCGTGYMIRPHIQNLNWGGINSALCSAPSQYMSCVITI